MPLSSREQPREARRFYGVGRRRSFGIGQLHEQVQVFAAKPDSVVAQLGLDLDTRGNIARDDAYMTSEPGVFVAGDAGRGQSLIVWAIAEGRAAAAGVDAYLTGRDVLPRPIDPTDRPLV